MTDSELSKLMPRPADVDATILKAGDRILAAAPHMYADLDILPHPFHWPFAVVKEIVYTSGGAYIHVRMDTGYNAGFNTRVMSGVPKTSLCKLCPPELEAYLTFMRRVPAPIRDTLTVRQEFGIMRTVSPQLYESAGVPEGEEIPDMADVISMVDYI